MIIIDKLVKRFGYFSILDGASWQIPEQGVYGFVGENGAGKSTLLRILAGLEEIDGGEVVVPKGVTIGYLPQEVSALTPGPLLQIVESGRQDLLDREVELKRLEEELRLHPGDALVKKYSEAHDTFERDGGYVWRSRAREILTGIGFSADQFQTPIEKFSGGWQMRAMLARLLLQSPSVLLLDEPTNHLDLETVQWLEGFLGRYQGCIVVVSHDRYFLNRMVDGIVELERGKISLFHGNYDFYRDEKVARRERQAQAAAQQRREIDRIENLIERFRYKQSKAKMVQSRIKSLEKMERIEDPDAELDSIHFQFPQPPRLGRIVIETKGLGKSFGDRVIYHDLNLKLERGEKVALVGPNGAGKTTLLKLLAKNLQPDSGEVNVGHNVEIAYFSQHAVDQLNPDQTVLDELWNVDTSKTQTEVRNLLAAFRFTGNEVTKKVAVLSGGEKSRLALAKLIFKPGGLLLLDEPTNHLDIGSRQTLECALNMFQGVFVVVSHDRYFVDEVATRILHIENGEVTSYVGDYSYYMEKRSVDVGKEPALTDTTEGSSSRMSKKELRQGLAEIRKRRDAEAGDLKKRLKKVEEEIHQLEVEIEKIEGTFADSTTYNDLEKVQKLTQRKNDADQRLEHLMITWEELATTMAAIDEKYDAEAQAFESS